MRDPEVIALRRLPAHLRVLAWPALTGLGPEGRPLRVEVPESLSAQPPAVKATSDAVLCSRPDGGPMDHRELERLLVTPELVNATLPLLQVVSVLALWDDLMQELGVFRGNVYLASEESVGRLLRLCGLEVSYDLVALLDSLQALELIYRFPAAFKFRGGYGPERQCRLNGWGRLLSRLLRGADLDLLPFRAWGEVIAGHITEYRVAYGECLARAVGSTDDSPERVWPISQTLPIPVLM